jgi:aminomethyltransferase
MRMASRESIGLEGDAQGRIEADERLRGQKVGGVMNQLKRTVFYDRHVSLNAKMVDFAGWEMPVFYPTGIVEEHLTTRKGAGLFDVSHMGRFIIRGEGSLNFLNHVLSNNAAGLDPRIVGAQYTLIPNERGGTVDDAYLYRFLEDEYLLVVNASNTEKDWSHFQRYVKAFSKVEMTDVTEQVVMLSVQGPKSRAILERLMEAGSLPEPMRNTVSVATFLGAQVMVARTGYTGEPLCFELFVPHNQGPALWDALRTQGATPVGLGARDTLRLEAGLALYGHELGQDPEGQDMPLLSFPIVRIGVSFSPLKGPFVGRDALAVQFEALGRIMERDYSMIADLPCLVQPVAVAGRGVARPGAKVFRKGKRVGYVTSGTMVPYWVVEGEGLASEMTDRKQLRSICLAYIASDIVEGDQVNIDIRGRRVEAVVVPYHLRNEAPPYSRPIIFDHEPQAKALPSGDEPLQARRLLERSLENHLWRQRECINLIPSEMTASPMVRMLSITDPSFRYAEHRKSKAFYDMEIYYYQGTDFIEEVERMVHEEMKKFLGCAEVETRIISGQMANMAVFSAMVDYINRPDRKSEQRRIRLVMNNHIGKGGHLSAQPMGALRDFVARDPHTERAAVVNFPVLPDNPYKIDIPKALDLVLEFRPEMIILGKSMVLHREPVAEICRFIDEQDMRTVVVYDMAHVLGLVGPYFQEPFKEGADLVTGSTHKTFFGTQRGIVGSPFLEHEERYDLWEAVQRRAFPGSASNHHLGTLLGLLMAAYEMNHFKNLYQPKVIRNAKAFARALKDCGLDVAGDPALDFTETHQVIVKVGYGRGPEIAKRLEENDIICNYQATPEEEGFTVAGALRLGVSEMTRFGMEEDDFRALAVLLYDVVEKNKKVTDQVKALRARFRDLQFCFPKEEYAALMDRLHRLL